MIEQHPCGCQYITELGRTRVAECKEHLMSAGIANKDCGCKVFLENGKVVHTNYCDTCYMEKLAAEDEAKFAEVDY